MIRITIGSHVLLARLEEQAAPKTTAAFCAMLPLRGEMMQAQWSGEAAWLPLGDGAAIPPEHQTTTPAPGQVLLYPGGISGRELLLPYGRARFACRDGVLAGNHFLTVTSGLDSLVDLGRRIVRAGAQPVVFERADR